MKQVLALTLLVFAGIANPRPAHAQSAAEAWVQRYNGSTASEEQVSKLVVDSAGNVIVAGSGNAQITGFDWVIIKYCGAGMPLWTNRYNGPANRDDVPVGLATDSSGNVFVTGSSFGNEVSDFVTIAYSSAGVPMWTNLFSASSTSHDEPTAVAVDGSGNVFVTGASFLTGISDYATIKYSGSGVPLWTNIYNGPGDFADRPNALAVDSNGNVFITGTSYVGPAFLSYDYATVAYSGAGTPMWTNFYNGPANDFDTAYAVAVDGSGNVFVSGRSPGLGSDYDYATIKYSGTGVPVWTNRYNGSWNGADQPSALAVDSSGNVFVTGSSYAGGHPYDSYDYATIAYSGSGALLWTNGYTGPGDGNDAANALALDGSGNVFVTGGSWNGTTFNYASIKYSGAGQPMWTNNYTGAGYEDAAVSLAVDGSGNVFVTGRSFIFASSYDFATLKYSGTGEVLWTNRYSGPTLNSDDQASAVAVDSSGNLFVTGSSYDNNSGSLDYATIKYSSAGVPLWTNRYHGGRDDFAVGVAADASGNVVVTGVSEAEGTGTDFATVKYSGSGVPLWTNRYNGPASVADRPTAVAMDSSGNVFVTGHSVGNGSEHDYTTIKYLANGMTSWTKRYNGPGNRDDIATALVVDGDGNVIITGHSRGNVSYNDYTTIKYSGVGQPLWTNHYNGPANGSDDQASAIVADASGNSFVTGTSDNDYATIKYSTTGAPLWTNRYDGPGQNFDYAVAAAVDRNGNLFVTGASIGSAGNHFDYATIAYSGAGVPLWTNRHSGTDNTDATATSVGVDGSGAVFVTGSAAGVGSVNSDYATVAYSGAGVPLWTNRHDGPANGDDVPLTKSSLAIGPDGSIYVTGRSDGDYADGARYDFATVKYTGSLLLTIARTTTNAVAISWPSGWTGFTLQEDTTGIGSANWSDVLTTPSDNGTTKTVVVNPPTGNRLYRLKSQ